MASLANGAAIMAGKPVNLTERVRGFGARVTKASSSHSPPPPPISAVFSRRAEPSGGEQLRGKNVKTEVSHVNTSRSNDKYIGVLPPSFGFSFFSFFPHDDDGGRRAVSFPSGFFFGQKYPIFAGVLLGCNTFRIAERVPSTRRTTAKAG